MFITSGIKKRPVKYNPPTISVITSSVGLRLDNSTDDYRTTNSPRPTAPRAWAALVNINQASIASYISSFSNSGLTNGWAIRLNAATLTANIGNGLLRQTPGYNISSWAGDGQIHGIVCTYSGHTGSGDLALYTDRSFVHSSSFTGYTDPTSQAFVVGGHSSSGFGFDGTIYGFAVCDVVPNLSSIQQWFDDCKTAVDVVAFNTGSSSIWSVRRGVPDLVSPWPDENGIFADISKNGTPELVYDTGFTFSW